MDARLLELGGVDVTRSDALRQARACVREARAWLSLANGRRYEAMCISDKVEAVGYLVEAEGWREFARRLA